MNPLLFLIPVVIIALTVLKPGIAQAAEQTIASRIDPNKAYPDTVKELASKWAVVFDIPRGWLRSQSFVESTNYPLKVNPISGTSGLMQIKLSTALDIARWLTKSKFLKHPKVKETFSRDWHGRQEDLLNPNLNMMFAAYYLRRLKARFGNNHNTVAAAYHQGPNAIEECIRTGTPFPAKAIKYIAKVENAKQRGYISGIH